MRLLKEDRGISLVEVVASIVLITIILISFFSFFIQSKKTQVASESIVDATYVAQKEMEELYGLISGRSPEWLMDPNNTQITLNNMDFIYDPTDTTCKNKCKKFLSFSNQEYWIQLAVNNKYHTLVNVMVNVPKESGLNSVTMESIFRWGVYP
ncbi:type IV pilus modification PilV family protein [Solibacillus silvestris]